MAYSLNDHLFPALPANGKILDVGAGSGKWSKEFASRGYAVMSIDKWERPSDLPPEIEWLQLDLSGELPQLAPESFAAVYMRNVIQFLPKEQFTEKLLPWAKSLLQNGGVLGIETFFGMINPPPYPKPHPSYYTADELKTLCADMDILWETQHKADLKDLEGTTREFSITQLVARKR